VKAGRGYCPPLDYYQAVLDTMGREAVDASGASWSNVQTRSGRPMMQTVREYNVQCMKSELPPNNPDLQAVPPDNADYKPQERSM
jgi:hypothetical protein